MNEENMNNDDSRKVTQPVKKNNKNKIIILVAILVVLVLVALAIFIFTGKPNDSSKENKTESGEEVKKTISPLMYEITKEGSDNKIYLFGSMHATNLDEFEFPKYVNDAYSDSDYLAVEMDIQKVMNDEKLMQEELDSYLYKDGTSVKDHVSEETYQKIEKFMKEKFGEGAEKAFLDEYNSYFFELIISSFILTDSNIQSDDGVDLYFINMAKEDKKDILEIESYEYQSSILTSFSDRLYELLINSYLDNYDEQVSSTKKLYELWKKGDPEELSQFINEDIDFDNEDDKKIVEEYNKKIYDDRNIGMKDKLEEYFNNNQRVFYMVGAAHLVGDNGLASLLQKDGYTVTQVNK